MHGFEKESLFKSDFSYLSGLAEPKILEKEDLPLVNVLALNSLQLF